jgi:acetyl-CoA C-acetyltransferase
MPEAVIVAAARTPIGRAYKGALAGVRPDDLAATAVRAALDAVPELDPVEIEDLILGCGSPGGEQGFNLGRTVAVQLGLDTVPGVTVTRYCSSSLQSTRMAFHAIKSGEGDVFVSAGVEAVSRYVKGSADAWPDTTNPLYAAAMERTAARSGEGTGPWVDPREEGNLPDIYIAMGQTAENVAQVCGVTRQEMDDFALRSQRLAAESAQSGFWAKEITPVGLPDGSTFSEDESPRPGTTMEGLAGLAPAFRPDGTVTAGNACPLNDGAAALVVMSDTRARELGIQPLARIVSTGVSGLSPEIMGLGPVEASRAAIARAGMSVADLDRVEINEAFAAQVIPSYQALGVDLDRVNTHGGGIALGHPFGMTGARITCTLLNILREDDQQFGLETMCVGGGQGMAMIIERLS